MVRNFDALLPVKSDVSSPRLSSDAPDQEAGVRDAGDAVSCGHAGEVFADLRMIPFFDPDQAADLFVHARHQADPNPLQLGHHGQSGAAVAFVGFGQVAEGRVESAQPEPGQKGGRTDAVPALGIEQQESTVSHEHGRVMHCLVALDEIDILGEASAGGDDAIERGRVRGAGRVMDGAGLCKIFLSAPDLQIAEDAVGIEDAVDGEICRQPLFDLKKILGKGVVGQVARPATGGYTAGFAVEVEGMVGVDRESFAAAWEDELAAATVAGEIVMRDRPHGDDGTRLDDVPPQPDRYSSGGRPQLDKNVLPAVVVDEVQPAVQFAIGPPALFVALAGMGAVGDEDR